MTRVYSREETRAIPIRARRASGGVLSGEAKTRRRGFQGLEFADFREYEPGDEVSRIDWNVTARLGKPWVRTYLEQRGHPVLVMADVSSSTLCGRDGSPAPVIADVAARLASAAIWNGCETALVLFADRVRKYVSGATGAAHLVNNVRELKKMVPGETNTGETNLGCALDYVQTLRYRRCLIFLISDFLCSDFAKPLRRCAARHEIVAIGVGDWERTFELPDCGLVNLRDPETGCRRQIDTGSREARSAFAHMIRARHGSNVEAVRDAGVDYLELNTNPGYPASLIAFLRQRAV